MTDMKTAIRDGISSNQFTLIDVIAFSFMSSAIATRPDDVSYFVGLLVGATMFAAVQAIGWVIKKCLS